MQTDDDDSFEATEARTKMILAQKPEPMVHKNGPCDRDNPCIGSAVYPVEWRDGVPFVGHIQVWMLRDEWWQRGGKIALGLCRHAMLKQCAECSSSFIAHHSRRYCSEPCEKAAQKRSVAKYRQERREMRNAPWNRRYDRHGDDREMRCPVCNKWFERKRTDTKFCSPACKQKAYRERDATAIALPVA
jgi:hypothetical protein